MYTVVLLYSNNEAAEYAIAIIGCEEHASINEEHLLMEAETKAGSGGGEGFRARKSKPWGKLCLF